MGFFALVGLRPKVNFLFLQWLSAAFTTVWTFCSLLWKAQESADSVNTIRVHGRSCSPINTNSVENHVSGNCEKQVVSNFYFEAVRICLAMPNASYYKSGAQKPPTISEPQTLAVVPTESFCVAW